ncbi:hypothetical protein RCJ22_27370 [Vibrio sp. FNV 38]|nr:hypothetical protein [Vibrio sp. FNV 38]
MYNKNLLALGLVLSLSACSHQQASQLGVRGSTVNSYAQYMTNLELCETLYFGRSTTQTQVAIAAEFNRRSLSKSWCVEQYQMWYAERIAKSLLAASEDTSEAEATIQPVTMD